MKIRSSALLGFFVVVLLLAGWVPLPVVAEEKESVETEKAAQELSSEEQKSAAYEIFKEILTLSDSPEREKNLPQIKALYREIIEKYPDLGLAQEAYLRLIMLAKEEKTAAGNAEAENVYAEFSQKYPDSKIQRILENELKRE